MKKGIIIILLLAFVCTTSLFAQGEKSTTKAYKTTFVKNGLGDNWVISIGGGGQILISTDDDKAYFKDRITAAPIFSIAKYFSPIWGLRMQLTGGTLHGFNDGKDGTYVKWNAGSRNYQGQGYAGTPGYPTTRDANFMTWDPEWNYLGYSLQNNQIFLGQYGYEWVGAEKGQLYMQHINYGAANFDFMVDLCNLFGVYNPKRVFSMGAFVGVGYYHAFPNMGNNAFDAAGARVGLSANIRLSERLKFSLEANGSMVPNGFDGQVGGRTAFDAMAQGIGTLSYAIGKTYWNVADLRNQGEIDDLNQRINDLRAELAKPIPPCPPCPQPPVKEAAPVVTKRFLPDPVFFRIDKSVIDASEQIKIQKAANYLNANTSVNVVVTGYADKKTAYPAYNLKLSERRSKTVARELTTKYGINPLRVSVNWEGDKIQPFETNNWNRLVIFVLEDQK